MIKKAIGIAAVLAAALTVTVSAGAVPCCFTNGSFETNDLTGWTPNLTSGVASTLPGGAPGGGRFHARVDTDGSSAGAWQSLSQTSFGPAGWIRGWARFNNGDDCFTANDQAEVRVDNVVVFSGSSCGGSTGWVSFGTYVTSGGHTVTARVANDYDTLFDSSVDLDAVFRDVRFAPTPTGGP